jgi:hypothetical protein
MLAAAFLCATAGLAWLALAMETHWQQVVRGPRPPTRRAVIILRMLGASALAVSLALCLGADHGSMAALVWVMALAAGALVVAFTLAWRPRTLAPLLAWSNDAGSSRLRANSAQE